ncbi:MAG: SurA N-terminal domain-containing protein [Proteobacteria bacterium]|nr:SurA N-terminal domain-containing protein [Pseudomonadota bacterium]
MNWFLAKLLVKQWRNNPHKLAHKLAHKLTRTSVLFMYVSKLVVLVVMLFVMVFGEKEAYGRMIYDRIVGVASGQPVLLSEVRKKVDKGPLVFISEYPSDTTDTLFDRALHDALNFALIKNAAAARGIEVEEGDVDEHIIRITQQQKATVEDLKQFLQSQGMSYMQYRKDLADQILWQKFQGVVLMPTVRISDRRLKEHYHMSYQRSPDDIRYNLEGLYVSSKTLAQRLYEKLANREISVQAMREPSKLDLGSPDVVVRYDDLGAIGDSELSEAIRLGLKGLEAGRFSPPIQTGTQSYYILYIKAQEVSEKPHYVEKKEELRALVRSQELRSALRTFLHTERSKEAIYITP